VIALLALVLEELTIDNIDPAIVYDDLDQYRDQQYG
jgi:hypothetical protein